MLQKYKLQNHKCRHVRNGAQWKKLAKEKEVVGIYISGHPLDDYKFEMKYFYNTNLEGLKNLEQQVGKTFLLVEL